jgi:transposase
LPKASSKFAIVSGNEWKLVGRVGKARKNQLLKTPFESILRRILKEVRLVDHGRETIKACPGSTRVWLKLQLSSKTVDLFHNGAGGYRAQFYLDMQQGAQANRRVIKALLQKLKRLCAAEPKRTCSWDFIKASICDADAKIWIHQGLWHRRNRRDDRHLMVDRWVQNGKTMKLRKKEIPSWAQLTPNAETRLWIKGGCLDAQCRSIGVRLKPCRNRELHYLGYT